MWFKFLYSTQITNFYLNSKKLFMRFGDNMKNKLLTILSLSHFVRRNELGV